MHVTVYTTPECPWCKKVKEFLDSHSISFDEKDVSEEESARDEVIDKSGQMGVPVLDIDGKILVGYDEKKLKEALGV